MNSIWDQVCEADPRCVYEQTERVRDADGKWATEVTGHGALAAWKIQEATKLWGPMGWGWGPRNERFEVVTLGHKHLVTCLIDFVFPVDDDDVGGGEAMLENVPGAAMLQWDTSDGVKTEPGAWSAARTNAIAKALENLGFGADAKLGRYKDARYVVQQRRKFGLDPAADGDADGGAPKPMASAEAMEHARQVARDLMAEVLTSGADYATGDFVYELSTGHQLRYAQRWVAQPMREPKAAPRPAGGHVHQPPAQREERAAALPARLDDEDRPRSQKTADLQRWLEEHGVTIPGDVLAEKNGKKLRGALQKLVRDYRFSVNSAATEARLEAEGITEEALGAQLDQAMERTSAPALSPERLAELNAAAEHDHQLDQQEAAGLPAHLFDGAPEEGAW